MAKKRKCKKLEPKKRKYKAEKKAYPNSGIIFKNGYKTDDTQPDYTGKATIDGVEYRVAGWWKYKEGKPPFLTMTFQKDVPLEPPPKSKPIKNEDLPDIKPPTGDEDPPF